MFQPHIIGRSHINFALNLFARLPIVQELIAAGMVAVFREELAKDFRHIAVIDKGRAIAKSPLHGTRFAHQGFDKLANRHARREGVRVDDNIGLEAIRRKRHIRLGNDQTYRAFLAAPTTKFIANVGDAFISQPHFRQPKPLLTFGHKGFIDIPQLAFLRQAGRIAKGAWFFEIGRHFPDKNRFFRDIGVFFDQPVFIELRIIAARL